MYHDSQLTLRLKHGDRRVIMVSRELAAAFLKSNESNSHVRALDVGGTHSISVRARQ